MNNFIINGWKVVRHIQNGFIVTNHEMTSLMKMAVKRMAKKMIMKKMIVPMMTKRITITKKKRKGKRTRKKRRRKRRRRTMTRMRMRTRRRKRWRTRTKCREANGPRGPEERPNNCPSAAQNPPRGGKG